MTAVVSPGVVTRDNGAALARYCDATVRWLKAVEFLDKNGEVYSTKDKDGRVTSVQQFPQVAMYHKFGLMLLRLEQEFGLTPAARTRVQTVTTQKPKMASDGPPVLKIAQ